MAEDDPAGSRLLIVEDDRELADMLVRLFSDGGFVVDLAGDGHSGLHLALSRTYRVMIVDRRLPALDGLEMVARLRRRGVTTRVLVLSAIGDHPERVRGLNGGADDYVVKPFDVDELVARVRALTRRYLDDAVELPLGAALLDVQQREVTLPDGRRVALSPREFDLLLTLVRQPKMVHTRQGLRRQVFADTKAESVVDTYVYYLRRKLGAGVVRTVRGTGYQIGVL